MTAPEQSAVTVLRPADSIAASEYLGGKDRSVLALSVAFARHAAEARAEALKEAAAVLQERSAGFRAFASEKGLPVGPVAYSFDSAAETILFLINKDAPSSNTPQPEGSAAL